jgi:hypothetical protein
LESSFQAQPRKIVSYPHYRAPETSITMLPSCFTPLFQLFLFLFHNFNVFLLHCIILNLFILFYLVSTQGGMDRIRARV